MVSGYPFELSLVTPAGALAPVPGGPPSSFTCCTELHELVRAACNFAGTVGAGGSFECWAQMVMQTLDL